MYDFFHEIDYQDHILGFNGIHLICAKYEPDYNCLYDVEFDYGHFTAGDTGERIEVTVRYRGLEGTFGYQVDLMIDGNWVKTMAVQTTPNGNIYFDKPPLMDY